jgi:hypothetical protein
VCLSVRMKRLLHQMRGLNNSLRLADNTDALSSIWP